MFERKTIVNLRFREDLTKWQIIAKSKAVEKNYIDFKPLHARGHRKMSAVELSDKRKPLERPMQHVSAWALHTASQGTRKEHLITVNALIGAESKREEAATFRQRSNGFCLRRMGLVSGDNETAARRCRFLFFSIEMEE